MEPLLTIGALARATGVSPKTIRYYEQVGVLPAPARSAAGYRQYTRRDVHRLLFIRRARALGLPLQSLKTLITELDGSQCGAMRPRLLALVSEQLHTVEQRIAEFQLLRQQLEHVVQRLQTAPLTDHTEGCRCLDLETLPAGHTVPPQLLPRQSGGMDMHRQETLEPLTLLPATQCGDGSCGCGCGLSLVELQRPQPTGIPASPQSEDDGAGQAPPRRDTSGGRRQ